MIKVKDEKGNTYKFKSAHDFIGFVGNLEKYYITYDQKNGEMKINNPVCRETLARFCVPFCAALQVALEHIKDQEVINQINRCFGLTIAGVANVQEQEGPPHGKDTPALSGSEPSAKG